MENNLLTVTMVLRQLHYRPTSYTQLRKIMRTKWAEQPKAVEKPNIYEGMENWVKEVDPFENDLDTSY